MKKFAPSFIVFLITAILSGSIAGCAGNNDVDVDAAIQTGAIVQVKEYLQTVQIAIGDGRFSRSELASISQLGANAAASFSSLGGHDLVGLPDMINGLTGSFARGGLPDVNVGLGSLQNSLPSIR